MMTSDPVESRLMEAVCRQPPDDEPRLAYADWIESHAGEEGVARADYIRRTIRAYREKKQLSDYTSVSLMTDPRRAAWSNGVDGAGVRFYDYVRGFVAYVRADAATLIGSGVDLARRCPMEYVGVTAGAKSHLADLLRAPWMEHVFAIDLSKNGLTDDDVTLIANSGLDLRWIDLGGSNVSMRAAEEMAAATAAGKFPELHTLFLPLPIYDDVEAAAGGFSTLVERSEAGAALRAKYGDIAWLTPTGRGGQLHA